MPRPAALPAAPRPAPDPTGRLWGVMHRHVRRDRFHADPRRLTGAILRFPDGTLPREREVIAESVTGGFRVVTHDGYRMAGQRIRPCGGANRAGSTVQFSSASIMTGDCDLFPSQAGMFGSPHPCGPYIGRSTEFG